MGCEEGCSQISFLSRLVESDSMVPSLELECMPCRPYMAERTSLAVMLGHFLMRGTSAFTRERTLGLSDFIPAKPVEVFKRDI